MAFWDISVRKKKYKKSKNGRKLENSIGKLWGDDIYKRGNFLYEEMPTFTREGKLKGKEMRQIAKLI